MQIVSSVAKAALVLSVLGAAFMYLSGTLGAATSGRTFLSHWFGPSMVECPPFNVQFAFERGAISFEPPASPDGARMFARSLHERDFGPLTVSVEQDKCVIVFRIERA